jgi:hypothetical protein
MINEKQLTNPKGAVIQVLSLLFPSSVIVFTPRSLIININEEMHTIDEENFDILQNTLQNVFCLNKTD